MMFLLLAAAGYLVWYLVKHQGEKPVWAWVGLAAIGLALVCGAPGFRMSGGMMGGGMWGRGMMDGGMMGRGMMGRGGMMNRGGQGMMNPGYMGRGMMNGTLTGKWVWVALGVRALLAAIVIIVAVVLIRRAVKWYNQKNSPMGILQARLAKGEISAEEFETLRAKLQG